MQELQELFDLATSLKSSLPRLHSPPGNGALVTDGTTGDAGTAAGNGAPGNETPGNGATPSGNGTPGNPARDKHYRQALLAVLSAVDLSRGYVARIRTGEQRKLAHGTQALRYAWSTASVELFPLDGELSRRCMLRGFYWSDPASCSEEEVEEASTALEEAWTTVRELLSASGSLPAGTDEGPAWREETKA